MKLKGIREIDINNKTVLYRSPYDIGTKKVENLYVLKDNSRIKATLPTLKYLLLHNCKIVILTYVKRPQGYDPALSTKPHAIALSRLLKHPVKHLQDCIGDEIRQEISNMKPKEIIMLENVRFYHEENKNDDDFAKALARNGELIVFDGFPQAHRRQSSTTGILKYLPAYAGFYLEKEVEMLESFMNKPLSPLTLIIGGIKFESKLSVVENFLKKADHILIGGKLPIAPKAKALSVNSNVQLAHLTKNGLDINQSSINIFKQKIDESKTVIWAGPMGFFEKEDSAHGTKSIAKAISTVKKRGGQSLVAGGDTIEALKKFEDPAKISYISLAGGATLQFLTGKTLPVLEMLKDE